MKTTMLNLAAAIFALSGTTSAFAGVACDLNVTPPTLVVFQVKTDSSIGGLCSDVGCGAQSATGAALFEDCRKWIADNDNVSPETRGEYRCGNYKYFTHTGDEYYESVLSFATVDVIHDLPMSVGDVMKAKCTRLATCLSNATTVEQALELRKAAEAFGCQ